MADIKHPKLLYLKGGLFVLTGLLAVVAILLMYPHWQLALLLAIAIWSFCRAYYFAFYVIQHYIDPRFRFAGLWDFACYLCGRKQTPTKTEM
ncbi:hypothetical protein NA78x_004539 [Anatilimnocola sp. NA78]|uniref:hypothetical protein n=1 Tax=Anatilimnocola sp. NA78 TaxID=3415683 RepID=UPI003CE45D95